MSFLVRATMNQLVDYNSDSDESTSVFPTQPSLPTLSSAPTVTLTAADERTLVVAAPTNPNQHTHPSGTIESIELDSKQFDIEQRSFTKRGTFTDPETGRSRAASIIPAPPPSAASPIQKRARAEPSPVAERTKNTRRKLAPFVPSTELFLEDATDYQGRSWIERPAAAKTFEQLEEYTPYIPKRCVYTMKRAHESGVSVVKFFPHTGHLLLSVGLDGAARIWRTEQRDCVRLYSGHAKGIRDMCFSNDGRRFLSASYDGTVKLWDTESGRVMGNFAMQHTKFSRDGAIPYCVRFNPDEDKQNEFLVGGGNKKIVQIDVRDANKIVQQYDRHMGPVNSITFVDENRRFVSSADDKLVCVWDYGIPVVVKYISDPSMHSMPVTALHPNRKSLACQSMDNRVLVYSARDTFKQNTKRMFKGHLSAGYACGLTYSTDGRFIGSGDSLGRLFFWDWKTCRMFRSLQAHNGVCIGLDWHPTAASLVASCGWDGNIKLWD